MEYISCSMAYIMMYAVCIQVGPPDSITGRYRNQGYHSDLNMP